MRSAGLLLHRKTADGGVEVLIVHPGGPLWARRDAGAWSIPKGELEPGEEPLAAARREFAEELGVPVPPAGDGGDPVELGEVRLKSGKRVLAWALAADLDVEAIVPGTFAMQWPPRSGVTAEFPEIDRALWCDPQTAREKLNPAQAEFVDRLLDMFERSTT